MDCRTYCGTVVGGYRINDRLTARSARALRLKDRYTGVFWLLEVGPEEQARLSQPFDNCPQREVVPVLASGTLGPGLGYLIVDHGNGPTLDDLLDGGPVESRRATAILQDVARGLLAVHQQGRVLVDLRSGDIRMIDDRARIPSTPLLLGVAVGRSRGGYCAPESEAYPTDPRVDQYCLGVIGFELLTGATPHNPDAPPGERTLAPLDFGRIPADLAAVLDRLLQPAAQRRFRDMSEVIDALNALTGTPDYGHFTPVLPAPRTGRPPVAPEGDDETGDSMLTTLLLLLVVYLVAMGASTVFILFW